MISEEPFSSYLTSIKMYFIYNFVVFPLNWIATKITFFFISKIKILSRVMLSKRDIIMSNNKISYKIEFSKFYTLSR